MRTASHFFYLPLILAAFFAPLPKAVYGDLSVPLALNSRPGAPYTIYLDFGGFSFNGNWGNDSSQTPGVTPAYTIDGDANTFSTTELADIKNIWSRVAEKYSWANVNVTTVDPAIAAGQTGSDSLRQTYYDGTAKLMHTVIGGSGSWLGDAGGISYLGVTGKSQRVNGYHTNWVFSAESPTNLRFIGEGAAHENGHGFNLNHQSDYSGNTLINEYSSGDSSRAPIMGNSYSSQRGLWKVGTADAGGSTPTTQNDVRTMLTSSTNPGFVIAQDGIGHTLSSATTLPLTGTSINYNSATGVIVPSGSSVTTSGLSNYTSDYWSFTTVTGAVVATVTPGRESITPGTADPGAMLDASLQILDSSGNVVASSITSGLAESITTNLQAGTYYLKVLSAADPNNTGFYDLGSYFLSGTIKPLLDGDFNHDGYLSAADILAMQKALTTGSPDLQSIGDLNHDGVTTNADLQTLVTLLKNGGGSSEPVPEPCSLALIGMGAFALLVSRTKSRA